MENIEATQNNQECSNCDQHENLSGVTSSLSQVLELVQKLEQEIAKKVEELTQSFNAQLAEKQVLIDKLFSEYDKLQDLKIEESKKDSIDGIIDVHHRIYDRLQYALNNAPDEDDTSRNGYDTFVENLKFDVDYIELIIARKFGMEYFEPKEGDEFDMKMHKAIAIETTEEEELNATVKDVLYGGFKKISDGKLLRIAEVRVWKYEIQKN